MVRGQQEGREGLVGHYREVRKGGSERKGGQGGTCGSGGKGGGRVEGHEG